MSYSPWDLHDNIEEQLTVLGFLPSDVEHSNEDIWTAFDQLVEKYQEHTKLLVDVVNSYEVEGCDGCGTIDQSVHDKIVEFVNQDERNRHA